MTFNKNKFKELISVLTTTEPCVSIYIPTYRAGHVQEDKIRFKNALSKATEKLVEGKIFLQNKMDKKEARKFLSPAYELLDNDEFWLHLSDGLAVFINRGRFDYFVAPIDFHPFVFVGKSFYVRHLLPLLTRDDRFFLLALSQGDVRFYECHKHHITPITIKDLVPENIEETIIGEPTAALQAHSAGSGATAFHGQGGGKDDKITNLTKYFRQIDNGLMQMLHDEDVPMILAAVDYLVPIYKEVSNHPYIMESHVSGNPENDGPILLHEKAWREMKGFFKSERKRKKELFNQYLHQDKASSSLTEIVSAAQAGRVETLFVDKDTAVVWGFHKQLSDHSVQLHEEQNEYNTCLLNYAAVKTWENGGTVYNVPQEGFPIPDVEANAIFRY